MKSWVQLNYIQHFVIAYKQRRQKSFICEEKQQMCRSYFLRGGALWTKTKVSFKNYNRFAVRKVPEQLLKILNGIKLILDDQGKHLDSYTYNQFEIIQVLQSPILQTSNWSGTFFVLLEWQIFEVAFLH